MLNFLLICISSTQNDEFLQTAYDKMAQFFSNVIDAQVFNPAEDRFVIYLEDLYARSDCDASVNLEERLRFKLRELNVLNVEFRTNNSKQIIVDYLRRISDLKRHPNFSEHLNLFYKIARIAAAPTLLKELIQQFALHYETSIFQCTTVYHDLDMRYAVDRGRNVRALYHDTHDPIIAPYSRKVFFENGNFDVFWGLNAPTCDQNIFLDVFLNTLYFTITHSYWGMHTFDPATILNLKMRIFKNHIGFVNFDNPSIPDDDSKRIQEFEQMTSVLAKEHISVLFELSGFIAQWISAVNQSKSEYTAIIGFHNGERCISPFIHFSAFGSFDSDSEQLIFEQNKRITTLPRFFVPSYVIPLRKWYEKKHHISPPMNRVSASVIEFSPFVFNHFEFSAASSGQHETVFEAEKLGLTKTLKLLWGRIPIFPTDEIISIIAAYPYMEDVIRMTVPLREFALRPLPEIYSASVYYSMNAPPLRLIPIPSKKDFWTKLSQQY